MAKGIKKNKIPDFFRDFTHWVYNWRGIHQKLNTKLNQEFQISVLGRHRCEYKPKAQTQ